VRAGDLLRDLDRRLLPPLAGRLDRLARSGRGGWRRRRPRPLIVAALASVTAVVAVVLWTAAHPPPPDPAAAAVARVGVVDGQSVAGYVAASRSELARLVAAAAGTATRTYALVMLNAYLAPDPLGPTLAGVEVAQVHTRVPLPDRRTAIGQIPVAEVPADVVEGMATVAAGKDREAREYRSLSAKLTGGGRDERRLRAAYAGQAQLAAAEAAAYRAGCSCVYAAVVRGAPAALDGLAGRPEVRAVDPAPEVSRLDRAVFLPPLPEQTGTAPSTTGQPARGAVGAEPRRHPASGDRPSGPATAGPATSGAATAGLATAGTPSRSPGGASPTPSARGPSPSPTPAATTPEPAPAASTPEPSRSVTPG
jgi:hypothetical protein